MWLKITCIFYFGWFTRSSFKEFFIDIMDITPSSVYVMNFLDCGFSVHLLKSF